MQGSLPSAISERLQSSLLFVTSPETGLFEVASKCQLIPDLEGKM